MEKYYLFFRVRLVLPKFSCDKRKESIVPSSVLCETNCLTRTENYEKTNISFPWTSSPPRHRRCCSYSLYTPITGLTHRLLRTRRIRIRNDKNLFYLLSLKKFCDVIYIIIPIYSLYIIHTTSIVLLLAFHLHNERSHYCSFKLNALVQFLFLLNES
ncbi:hypothetical protein, no similarity [Maudiozyma saulgeensis]|uniref:Uncharacterized protein n=1 Tax=Maudiozyma saulgeensis TaxID=1789683 RepID=A0A1X7R564_9SACH|nr:hypothetical protein, no similarity [Kazachstania saulgeensis]